jgi:tryptophan synthase alpha chain
MNISALYRSTTGLLVPDIPQEETLAVREVCEKYGMELVLLASPTTPSGRMEVIVKSSLGFLSLMTVTRMTGVKEQMESRVEGLVSALHGVTVKPVSECVP